VPWCLGAACEAHRRRGTKGDCDVEEAFAFVPSDVPLTDFHALGPARAGGVAAVTPRSGKPVTPHPHPSIHPSSIPSRPACGRVTPRVVVGRFFESVCTIPYRTSSTPAWGLCVSRHQLSSAPSGGSHKSRVSPPASIEGTSQANHQRRGPRGWLNAILALARCNKENFCSTGPVLAPTSLRCAAVTPSQGRWAPFSMWPGIRALLAPCALCMPGGSPAKLL
jgi:hypothetical protein